MDQRLEITTHAPFPKAPNPTPFFSRSLIMGAAMEIRKKVRVRLTVRVKIRDGVGMGLGLKIELVLG